MNKKIIVAWIASIIVALGVGVLIGGSLPKTETPEEPQKTQEQSEKEKLEASLVGLWRGSTPYQNGGYAQLRIFEGLACEEITTGGFDAECSFRVEGKELIRKERKLGVGTTGDWEKFLEQEDWLKERVEKGECERWDDSDQYHIWALCWSEQKWQILDSGSLMDSKGEIFYKVQSN